MDKLYERRSGDLVGRIVDISPYKKRGGLWYHCFIGIIYTCPYPNDPARLVYRKRFLFTAMGRLGEIVSRAITINGLGLVAQEKLILIYYRT